MGPTKELMTAQNTLLPCPFCNCSEILVKKKQTTMIECKDCGAVVFNYQDGVERDAIDAWNRRAPNAPRAIGYMAAGRVQQLLDGQAVMTTITTHQAFMDDAVIYAASAAKGA